MLHQESSTSATNPQPTPLERAVAGTRAENVLWRAFRGFDYADGACVDTVTLVIRIEGTCHRLDADGWTALTTDQANQALLELGQMYIRRLATSAEYENLAATFGSRLEKMVIVA
jgi:hypothetical protein